MSLTAPFLLHFTMFEQRWHPNLLLPSLLEDDRRPERNTVERENIPKYTPVHSVGVWDGKAENTAQSSTNHFVAQRLNNLMTKVIPAKFWWLLTFTTSALISNFTWKLLVLGIVLLSAIRQWYLAVREKEPPALQLLQWSSQMCVCGAWSAAQVHQLWVLWVATGLSCANNTEWVQKWQMWQRCVKRSFSNLQ